MTGEVVYFFAFDVANELLFEPARRLLGERARLAAPGAVPPWPRGLALPAPLAVVPAGPWPALGTANLRVEVHLFEFGAVSVVMSAAFEADSLAALVPHLNPRFSDNRGPEQIARDLCSQVYREILPALVRPSEVGDPESYVAFCVRALGSNRDSEAWLAGHRAEVAGLLTGLPPDFISAAQVEEVFRHQRSLTRGDAVVLAWDAALVLDLGGPPVDVLFTIELANLQLEEFRQMDRAIDRFMDKAYTDLERRTPSLLGTSTVLRKLRRFRVDLARLADEVTNTTKVFGDWHLARVYLAARERFHLDRWRDSVTQRFSQLDQLYNLVRAELWDQRVFVLELFIAVLIVAEIVMGLIRAH